MRKKEKTNIEEIKVIRGSGNIYADMGHPNPEEAIAKAELAMLITATIKKKKLTQKKAAAVIGVDQPKISDIMRGKLSSFTLDRLFRFLKALGVGIDIVPNESSTKDSKPHLKVLPCTIHPINKNRKVAKAKC